MIRLNFHGDELHPLGGAEMGADIKAEAISHLEEVNTTIAKYLTYSNDHDIVRLAQRECSPWPDPDLSE